MCLSFSGAIRHLKKGSSILSIFRQIYLELSVPAILSEKPIFCCIEHDGISHFKGNYSNSNIHNCVLRLGSSHMCLSFSRAIRHLKKGSSILSIFRQIYLELSVLAILSEKPIFCCIEHDGISHFKGNCSQHRNKSAFQCTRDERYGVTINVKRY